MESRRPEQLELQFVDRPRLLIVDDNQDTVDMLSIFFSAHGYSVVTAPTGKAALDMIRSSRDFDVILLDVFIPDIGGMEVLTEINKQTHRPGVILLTALADRKIAQTAFRLGAFDYILKPPDLAQLESSVIACLGHNEYHKQRWWKWLAS